MCFCLPCEHPFFPIARGRPLFLASARTPPLRGRTRAARCRGFFVRAEKKHTRKKNRGGRLDVSTSRPPKPTTRRVETVFSPSPAATTRRAVPPRAPRDTAPRPPARGLLPRRPPQATSNPRAPGPRRASARVRKTARFRSSPGWVGGFSPRHVHGLRRLVRLPRGACGDARRRGAPRGARGGDPGRDRRLRPPPGFQPRRRRPRDRSTRSSSQSSPRRRFFELDPRRRGVGGVLRRVRRASPHRLRRGARQGRRGVGAVHRGGGRRRARQSLRDHGGGGSRSRGVRAHAAAAEVPAAAAVRAAAAAAAATASSTTTTTARAAALSARRSPPARAAAAPTPSPAAATTTPFDAESVVRPRRRRGGAVRPARLLRLRGVQVQGGV